MICRQIENTSNKLERLETIENYFPPLTKRLEALEDILVIKITVPADLKVERNKLKRDTSELKPGYNNS